MESSSLLQRVLRAHIQNASIDRRWWRRRRLRRWALFLPLRRLIWRR